MTHTRGDDAITQALAKNRLGTTAIIGFVMSAAGMLLNVSGVIPLTYGVTGNLGLPFGFILMGLMLILFSVGYTTMARHLPHAGPFYSYVARSMGGAAGCSVSWISLVGYNILQIALYGGVALEAPDLVKRYLGPDLSWWVYALILWAIVAALGVFKVDLNGKVLGVLLVAEVLLIVVFDLTFLTHPHSGYPLSPLSPTTLFTGGAGAAVLALTVTGYSGFETGAVYTEESRDVTQTVPRATYLATGMIAVFYAVSAWAVPVADGITKIATDGQPPASGELVFNLAGAHLGSGAADVGRLLLMTSLAAALISFHNTTSRYMFALGRERLLPRAFGRTSSAGAPRVASLTQSALALATILVFAVGGYDPLVTLFYTGGAAGGLALVALMAIASVAVVVFFARDLRGETQWTGRIAPTLSIIVMTSVLVLVVSNLQTLLGVDSSSPLPLAIPLALLVVALGGLVWGLVLRVRRPDIYSKIGLGAKSALTATPLPSAYAPAPVLPDGPAVFRGGGYDQ